MTAAQRREAQTDPFLRRARDTHWFMETVQNAFSLNSDLADATAAQDMLQLTGVVVASQELNCKLDEALLQMGRKSLEARGASWYSRVELAGFGGEEDHPAAGQGAEEGETAEANHALVLGFLQGLNTSARGMVDVICSTCRDMLGGQMVRMGQQRNRFLVKGPGTAPDLIGKASRANFWKMKDRIAGFLRRAGQRTIFRFSCSSKMELFCPPNYLILAPERISFQAHLQTRVANQPLEEVQSGVDRVSGFLQHPLHANLWYVPASGPNFPQNHSV